jgi:hypothetical protein
MDDIQRLMDDLEDAIIAEPAQYVTSAWLERIATHLIECGYRKSAPSAVDE